MARGGFVAGAHLVVVAGRLGGAAAPVVRTRQHDRIGRAVVDMGEMLTRRRRIVEIAQRDPAGHEMQFRPIVLIGRRRRVAHHLIGGLELTQIEQLSGENAPLAPPLIRVLERHGLGRCRQHHPGGVGNPIVPHQPVNAAERKAQILARLARDRVEQGERLVRFAATAAQAFTIATSSPPRRAPRASLPTDPWRRCACPCAPDGRRG